MPSTTIFGKSRNCFGTLRHIPDLLLILALCGCEHPGKAKTEEPIDFAAEAPAAPEFAQEVFLAADPRQAVEPLSFAAEAPPAAVSPSDPGTPTSPAQALVEQRKVIRKQVADVDATADEVAKIRWALIVKRFDVLDREAQARGWESKPPSQGTPEWKAYSEWKYIQQNRDRLKNGRRGRSNPPGPYMTLPQARQQNAVPEWAL